MKAPGAFRLAGVVAAGLLGATEMLPASIITASSSDQGLYDSTGDDKGDVKNAEAGSAKLVVGEPSTDTNEQRVWLPFALTTQERADIAAASSVTLRLSLDSSANVAAYAVDVYGVSGTITSGSTLKGDYERAATLLVANAFTSTTATGYSEFDVTSFAKTAASLSSSSMIVFRLQMNPATLPLTDGLWNRYTFNMSESTNKPQLSVVVPEPAGVLSLLGVAALGCVRRRRYGSAKR